MAIIIILVSFQQVVLSVRAAECIVRNVLGLLIKSGSAANPRHSSACYVHIPVISRDLLGFTCSTNMELKATDLQLSFLDFQRESLIHRFAILLC